MAKWNDSPLFRLALAACAALVAATNAVNGLTLGLATGCVLVLSGAVAALLDNFIADEKGRVALFMVISAVFAGIAQMIVKAVCGGTAAALGIYLPMIAVNCLLLARPADENGVGPAVSDGVKQALGFICLVTLLGALREFMDVGTVFGAQVLPKGLQLTAMAALPAGGLLLLGLLAGLANLIKPKRSGKEDEAA